MQTKLNLPLDQTKFIRQHFLAAHPLSALDPVVEWNVEASLLPGDRVPIVASATGRPALACIPWCNSALDQTNVRFARRCAVPARQIELLSDAGDELLTLSSDTEEDLLIAGAWRPFSEFVERPASFFLLTVPSGPSLEGRLARQPMFIRRADWRAWHYVSNEMGAFRDAATKVPFHTEVKEVGPRRRLG
jgi:hypothetical protein